MDEFKSEFKKDCFQLREDLKIKLIEFLESKEGLFARSLMPFFYIKKDKEIQFNWEALHQRFDDLFLEKSLFIADFDEINHGGYYPSKNIIARDNSSLLSLKEFNEFEICLFEKFWVLNDKNNIINDDLNSFFQDREPVGLKEFALKQSFFSLNVQRGFLGFYDIEVIIDYYKKIIEYFFSDFNFDQKMSSSKIYRFSKVINSDWKILLYIDFSVLVRELKNGYVEFPQIEIEISSININKNLDEKKYLVSQDDYLMFRVQWQHCFFAPKRPRVCQLIDQIDTKAIKKRMFYEMDRNYKVLKLYIQFVQDIVCK